MAGQEGEKRFDRKTAWWVKWGGLGVAIVGAATGVIALVVPGVIAAAGGLTYEHVTNPEKTSGPVRRRKVATAT